MAHRILARLGPAGPSRWRLTQRVGLGATLPLLFFFSVRTLVAAPVTADQASASAFQKAIAAGRYPEAETAARALTRANAPGAWTELGEALVAQGRYADAEQAFGREAKEIPDGEAALKLGLLLDMLGRHSEARSLLEPVEAAAALAAPTDVLYRAARAAQALGRFKEANRLFRAAAASGERTAAVQLAWGELFLEKYNRAEAAEAFEAAITAAPDLAEAHLDLARAVAEDDPPKAAAELQRALALNPNLVAGRVFAADLALDDGKRREARAELDRALAVNPNHLGARALMATLAFLEDRPAEFEAEVQRVLAINARDADLYRIVAGHAARSYRFDDAVALDRKAVQLDPADAAAQAALGINLLRVGGEEEGRTALERAFRADPYNVVTFNLLKLFDTFPDFVSVTTPRYVLRMHKRDAPILREYAPALIERALDTLTVRYQVALSEPVLIEIFPRHDDFAVRNVGLPGMVGALGACFGRVVTMDSPRARERASFNWGETLWHELAHVVTLKLSRQRVPRWLTEGISVFEERLARPEWDRDLDLHFAEAMNDQKILPLGDLNTGFTKPAFPEQVGLSYFEAALAVEMMVARFGQPGLHRLLRAYGEGKETPEAVQAAFGVPFDRLQADFATYLQAKYQPLCAAARYRPAPELARGGDSVARLKAEAQAHPESYYVHVALGRALVAAGDRSGAETELREAKRLVPRAVGPGSPRKALVQLALDRGDHGVAITELQELVAIDQTDAEAARQLATLFAGAGQTDKMVEAYRQVVAIDPLDLPTHVALGRAALALKSADEATREFRVALALDPVDPAAAHCDLAAAYLAAGQRREAKAEALAALEIAPTFDRAQQILLAAAKGVSP